MADLALVSTWTPPPPPGWAALAVAMLVEVAATLFVACGLGAI